MPHNADYSVGKQKYNGQWIGEPGGFFGALSSS